MSKSKRREKSKNENNYCQNNRDMWEKREW